MKIQQPIVYRDFSRGNIRTVQNSIVAQNSVKLALNLDSDKELGTLTSRLGTNIVGTQTVASATCYGLHYHRDTISVNHKLFGVFSDGANNDIYDMLTGTKSSEDDTPTLKTRFCTYLNSTVRVNGTDPVKSFNGSAWVDTGGAFDEADMPKGTMVIEWRDRIWTAGVTSSPNILYYSSIADPNARTINWTNDGTESNSGYIEIEQEDGGGNITALGKVPGYLIIFKERSMKRWDGETTYPDDLINVGVANQEAICQGRGMIFFANQTGIWATNGDYPKKISRPIQDLWDAIPIANIPNVCTYCDEDFVYFYVGDITLDGNTYSNICFKYNIDSQTYDIYSYYHDFTVFAGYISSTERVILGGDKNGQSIQINTGNTDYHTTVQPITFSLESQDLDFGSRARIKEISEMMVYTEGVNTCQVSYRVNSHQDSDWRSIRSITNDIEDIDNFKVKGNYFNIKLTGVTDSGQVGIYGFEFPENSVDVKQNVND